MHQDFSRRGFLKAAASAGGVAWLGAQWPGVLAAAQEANLARNAGAAFDALTAAQATDLAAIASQIFPSDATPGATEAGVIYFIDSALRGFMANEVGNVKQGLAALSKEAAGPFAALTPAAQTTLLKAHESSAFFGTVRFLTIAGMFALPIYGGNRNHAGWQLLGFSHRHVWAPPFGHYDTPAPKAGAKR